MQPKYLEWHGANNAGFITSEEGELLTRLFKPIIILVVALRLFFSEALKIVEPVNGI